MKSFLYLIAVVVPLDDRYCAQVQWFGPGAPATHKPVSFQSASDLSEWLYEKALKVDGWKYGFTVVFHPDNDSWEVVAYTPSSLREEHDPVSWTVPQNDTMRELSKDMTKISKHAAERNALGVPEWDRAYFNGLPNTFEDWLLNNLSKDFGADEFNYQGEDLRLTQDPDDFMSTIFKDPMQPIGEVLDELNPEDQEFIRGAAKARLTRQQMEDVFETGDPEAIARMREVVKATKREIQPQIDRALDIIRAELADGKIPDRSVVDHALKMYGQPGCETCEAEDICRKITELFGQPDRIKERSAEEELLRALNRLGDLEDRNLN